MRVRLLVGSACLLLLAACGSERQGAEGAEEPAPESPAAAATVEAASPGAGEAAEAEPDEAPAATPPAEPPTEPEEVIRAWSDALNADDNDAAADLFAPGAIVVQVGRAYLLRTHADAALWNSTLPCSGMIVQMTPMGQSIVAVFSLGDRPSSVCDAAPGTLAAARFVIENGLIQVWAQVAVPDDAKPPGPSVVA